MLRPTDQKLENLYFLRDVTFPWMRAHPERVDFDRFMSRCGTYGCVWGHYVLQRHKDATPRDLRHRARWNITIRGFSEFGISAEGRAAIFGFAFVGTLDDRAQVLDEIIAEREAALVDATEPG